MAMYYIAADVHVNNTELAIEYRYKIVQRYSVPTSIPAIGTVLGSLQGQKFLAVEEGPMAGWLYRNLSQEVDKFIVCEPRRNKLSLFKKIYGLQLAPVMLLSCDTVPIPAF